MIMIDVFSPVMERTFEFRCDETVEAGVICRDICHVLAMKTGQGEKDWNAEGEFWLCDPERQLVLAADRSLLDQQLTNASRLILL